MSHFFDLEVRILWIKLCRIPATLPYSVVGSLLQGFSWYISRADIAKAQPTYTPGTTVMMRDIIISILRKNPIIYVSSFVQELLLNISCTCSKSWMENLCPIGENGMEGEALPLSSVAAVSALLCRPLL